MAKLTPQNQEQNLVDYEQAFNQLKSISLDAQVFDGITLDQISQISLRDIVANSPQMQEILNRVFSEEGVLSDTQNFEQFEEWLADQTDLPLELREFLVEKFEIAFENDGDLNKLQEIVRQHTDFESSAEEDYREATPNSTPAEVPPLPAQTEELAEDTTAKPEIDPEAEVDPEPDEDLEPKVDPEAEVDPEPDEDLEPEVDPEPEIDPEP
ncbi:MAG: hypothetical protein KAG61_10645, partial [Bacteriovoracaceae bacterium]|nr:hypothetical protein [Bacteriovoracaceae bacterium]